MICFNVQYNYYITMAAYGVIGGAIGGAIALAIMPFLRKRIKNSNKNKGKKNQEQKSYKPGAAWFGFIVSTIIIAAGIFYFWYCLFECFNYIYFFTFLFAFCFGIIFACWSGSYLGARITITKEGLIIDHAAKMSNKEKSKIQMTQLGRHHLDLRWEDIRELRADINHMKIILQNGDVYSFPIGWCKEEARAAIARHKKIKPWE